MDCGMHISSVCSTVTFTWLNKKKNTGDELSMQYPKFITAETVSNHKLGKIHFLSHLILSFLTQQFIIITLVTVLYPMLFQMVHLFESKILRQQNEFILKTSPLREQQLDKYIQLNLLISLYLWLCEFLLCISSYLNMYNLSIIVYLK